MMRTGNDRSLIQRARHFEEEALSEIYDCYSPAIYRYALRLLGDADKAEECTAETFSRFLLALKNAGGPNDFLQAYLYRIAHNWITDFYRGHLRSTLPLEADLLADPADEPHQVVSDELERKQVRAALALLTPDQRQVILLKYLENWQNEEIARALDKPVGAVKALQHRAIASLRRLFLKQEELV